MYFKIKNVTIHDTLWSVMTNLKNDRYTRLPEELSENVLKVFNIVIDHYKDVAMEKKQNEWAYQIARYAIHHFSSLYLTSVLALDPDWRSKNQWRYEHEDGYQPNMCLELFFDLRDEDEQRFFFDRFDPSSLSLKGWNAGWLYTQDNAITFFDIGVWLKACVLLCVFDMCFCGYRHD